MAQSKPEFFSSDFMFIPCLFDASRQHFSIKLHQSELKSKNAAHDVERNIDIRAQARKLKLELFSILC